MTTRSTDRRRLLLVHAHPDDETIESGATIARYAAEGAGVTLVTCTLGEEGDIIPPQLRHLSPDELGRHRVGELERACAELGVTDHRFLGGAGHWRDSGMMGVPSNDGPRAFWQADLEEAANALVEIIEDVRPQVIVTYDENGFYGHPDHIQAHRVAWRAFGLVRGTRFEVEKFYYTALPTSAINAAPASSGFVAVPADELPYGCADDAVTTVIDASPYLDAKLAAMRAHATQITVRAPYYALSNDIGQEALGVEHYILRAGPRAEGVEDDLFAGIG